MTDLPDICVVILTRNEASVIERCITSVPFARKILVLDSGSSDDTCKIARNLGAQVIYHEWPGDFSRQRNIADSYVDCPWIFHLDADETVTSEMAAEIKQFFASGDFEKFGVGRFPRKELIFGRWIEHGGWYPQHKPRLYRKGAGYWMSKVHEHLEVEGEVHTFTAPILHDSYRDVHTFIEKFNRYSSLDAEIAFAEGKHFSLLKLFFQPMERFLGRYIIHKGYRDGFHGFVIASLIGLNYFMRYLKLWEKEYRTRSNDNNAVAER